jgi:hypothetical protein
MYHKIFNITNSFTIFLERKKTNSCIALFVYSFTYIDPSVVPAKGDGTTSAACFQMPLQRAAFFRTASGTLVASPSGQPVVAMASTHQSSLEAQDAHHHVDTSSPDESISDYPIVTKHEVMGDSDSSPSGGGGVSPTDNMAIHIQGHDQQGQTVHFAFGGHTVHASNVGLMQTHGSVGAGGVIGVKMESDGGHTDEEDEEVPKPPPKRRVRLFFIGFFVSLILILRISLGSFLVC